MYRRSSSSVSRAPGTKPYRQERRVAEAVQETGILEGRTRVYPGRYDPAADNGLTAEKA